MATLKHKKMQEDAFRKMLEESITRIEARLKKIESLFAQYEKAKQKPKGGRNV